MNEYQMIQQRTGSFMAEPGIKVIPVNCVGVPGAGLAKQWAQADPEAARRYTHACQCRPWEPGAIFWGANTDFVLATTKRHWRDPSQLQWIESCINTLVQMAVFKPILTIHIPPLGAGLGGLRKAQVIEIASAAIRQNPGPHSWVLWNF
jgi:hypothetical protein